MPPSVCGFVAVEREFNDECSNRNRKRGDEPQDRFSLDKVLRKKVIL